MKTKLATEGLPEFSLSGMAKTDSIGGSSATVNSACANLEEYASSMNQFIHELESQEQLILRDWEGEAAETLKSSFPRVIEAFEAVPECIRSISNWASDTMSTFEKIDQRTAEQISRVMRGV